MIVGVSVETTNLSIASSISESIKKEAIGVEEERAQVVFLRPKSVLFLSVANRRHVSASTLKRVFVLVGDHVEVL